MVEQFFHLECSDSYSCNIHHYCICHSQDILTVAVIGVGIYSIKAGRYNVFDSYARDMYHNSHSEGTCIGGNTSMHNLVQYF